METLYIPPEKVKLPAKIGQTKCRVEAEVVKVDIPPLLSKTSLKKAVTILDMENDRAVMFRQPVPLEFTSSGHYCVDIRDKDTEKSETEDEALTVTENMSTDKECITILQQIVHDCDICKRYSKTKPKPAAGLPLASEYNKTVAVDLHELEPGVWYLHIIDHFTRFSAGNIVKTKKSCEIVNSFIHTWISVHGPPRRLYSDNGEEFNNEEIRDMAENFNIETKQQQDTVPGATAYWRDTIRHSPKSSRK